MISFPEFWPCIVQPVSRRLPIMAAGFRRRSDQVIFVVDKVTLEQVYSEYFGFPCQFSFHRLLGTRHHLSSVVGTIVEIVADVPNRLSFTSPQETKVNYREVSNQNVVCSSCSPILTTCNSHTDMLYSPVMGEPTWPRVTQLWVGTVSRVAVPTRVGVAGLKRHHWPFIPKQKKNAFRRKRYAINWLSAYDIKKNAMFKVVMALHNTLRSERMIL
jgi:hypothetical protein